MKLFIEQQGGLYIVGEANNVNDLISQVRKLSPGLLLLDWLLVGFEPVHHVPVIRGLCPSMKIIVTGIQPEYQSAAKEYGLDGYISKTLTPDRFIEMLLTAIQCV